jgi:hypothetical protein
MRRPILGRLAHLVSRNSDSSHNSRAGHPVWLRCSSLKYAQYSHSSRLAIRAPRSGTYATNYCSGTLAPNFPAPIIDRGRNLLTLDADRAREQYQKIHARFTTDPDRLDLPGTRILRQRGREIEVMVNGNSSQVMESLRARSPEALAIEALTLEEIFVSTLQPQEKAA